MKVIETEGCTVNDITFDGKSWIDLTKHEQLETFIYLCAELGKQILSNEKDIHSLVEIFDEESVETDDMICEQCGDTVTTTTWTI